MRARSVTAQLMSQIVEVPVTLRELIGALCEKFQLRAGRQGIKHEHLRLGVVEQVVLRGGLRRVEPARNLTREGKSDDLVRAANADVHSAMFGHDVLDSAASSENASMSSPTSRFASSGNSRSPTRTFIGTDTISCVPATNKFAEESTTTLRTIVPPCRPCAPDAGDARRFSVTCLFRIKGTPSRLP